MGVCRVCRVADCRCGLNECPACGAELRAGAPSSGLCAECHAAWVRAGYPNLMEWAAGRELDLRWGVAPADDHQTGA